MHLASITALSAEAQTVRLQPYLQSLPETHSIAMFVGAMARGRDGFADSPFIDERISVSQYALSASVVCSKASLLTVLRCSRALRALVGSNAAQVESVTDWLARSLSLLCSSAVLWRNCLGYCDESRTVTHVNVANIVRRRRSDKERS